VDVDLSDVTSLFDVLPKDWIPQLVVAVSGGGIPMFTRTADIPCPTVFYSVDTWQCYMDYREALHYDLVFAGQRAFVPLLRAAGSRHVHWLPMACNPDTHYPIARDTQHDLVFVGGTSEPVHWQRAPLLHALQSHFDVLALERIYGAAMTEAYARGRAAFNHSAVHDVNMRIFEALAMGRPLLTNSASISNGLLDLFDDGRHLLVYEDETDLVRKTSQLLGDDALLRRLGDEGRTEVLNRHTYAHRIATILETTRAMAPGFPEDYAGPLRCGDHALDYIPRGTRSILDYGMGLRASKYALSKRGITKFAGFSRGEITRRQRAGSFDETYADPNELGSDVFDVVVLDAPHATDASVRAGWNALVPGGTLIATCYAASLARGEAIESWLRHRDFHVTFAKQLQDGTTIAVARKRTRRLRAIAREVCEWLHVPGIDADAVAALMEPDW
jgi:hypothetical protein